MSNKTRQPDQIFVSVSGGNVTAYSTSACDVKVEVIDYDNLKDVRSPCWLKLSELARMHVRAHDPELYNEWWEANKNSYTVIGFYEDSKERFSGTVEAISPEEAENLVLSGNGDTLYVCGVVRACDVFYGEYTHIRCKDSQ